MAVLGLNENPTSAGVAAAARLAWLPTRGRIPRATAVLRAIRSAAIPFAPRVRRPDRQLIRLWLLLEVGQGGGDGNALACANHGHGDLVANLLGIEVGGKRLNRGKVMAVDRGDDVVSRGGRPG